jgi:ribonuclease HII
MARVAGVDEAGVGPLAGPVVAAAVVFDPGAESLSVDDSKRLAPGVRRRLALAIRETAWAVGVGAADVHEIAMLNIYRAALLAMRRAVEALPISPDHVLVDARTIPGLAVSQRSVARGDSMCYCIAAASIVAKTWRDELMHGIDRLYPAYGFSRHKGYGTAEHVAALRLHGPCPAHRTAFPAVAAIVSGDIEAVEPPSDVA